VAHLQIDQGEILMTGIPSQTTLLDYEPAAETFLGEVIEGLSAVPRHLPCKYFYDERGSRLFDEICELDEYYVTRTELAIMEQYAGEMAEQIGPRVMLVEYGSGSSVKTRLLLDHLTEPVAYVPVDISREHLHRTADRLSRSYPRIEVLPVCADFTEPFELPVTRCRATHKAVYFPGSTIGNFRPDAARDVLGRIAPLCGTGGGLLIGIDLQKESSTLEAAYNDSEGVTAEFNLNLLRRINRELDGDFDLEQFEHQAVYNDKLGRIEISLVSQRDQIVEVAGDEFEFADGETICTEYSHKYTVDGFAELASEVGLTLRRFWTDDREHFGILHLAVLE
jgi:dimethylhistidine N-methyltransferase